MICTLYRFAARSRGVRSFLLTGIFMVGAAFLALGQTATIVGTVTDPSGSVVPNVAITYTNTDTNLSNNTTSNDAGQYIAADIPIGNYKIKAEAKGFKSTEKTGITLHNGDRFRVDIQLVIGATSETMTVEANAIRVQSDSGEISDVINQTQVTQLETNGRSWYTLSSLTPGASANTGDFQVPTPMGGNGTISFNGNRVAHNLLVVDGGEAADRGGSGAIVMPSLDAVAEFKMLTSNYDAQYGMSSSATVTTVLKSGTNQFHASGWIFDRDTAFDAYPYFTPAVNSNGTKNNKPPLRFQIYGFNVGGPVEFKHSDNPKTFFFYNMEWRACPVGCNGGGGALNVTTPFPSTYTGNLAAAIAQGNLLNSITDPNTKASITQPLIIPSAVAVPAFGVPGLSAAQITAFEAAGITNPNSGCNSVVTSTLTNTCAPGSFGGPWVGNQIPSTLLNPNAQALIKAGIFATPVSGDQFIGSPAAPTNVREELARVDHTFSDKFSIFGHWISEQILQTDLPTRWAAANAPTIGDTFGNPSYSAVVHTTYAISPTLLNEAAFNYDGNRINMNPTGIWQLSQAPGFTENKIFGFNNGAIPQIHVIGRTGYQYNDNWNPWDNTADDYAIKDDVSWTKGTHQIKMGFGWANFRKNQPLQTDPEGEFQFNGTFTNYDFADYLLGLSSNYTEPALEDHRHWNNVSWDGYVQDNWRATHRLTLNLGLRWDGMPHTAEINGQMSNFYPNLYNPAKAPTLAQFVPGSNFGALCSPANVTAGVCASAAPTLATGPNPDLNGLLAYTNGLGVPGGPGGLPSVSDGLVRNHWANFGPRIGVAYDVTGSGKTIFRAGFGVMYERIQGNDMYQAQTNLFGGNATLQNVSLTDPHTGVDANNQTISAASLPVPVSKQTALDNTNYRNPASFQFSAGIQQQIGASSVLSLAYVGTQNRYQSEATNINPTPLNELGSATPGNYESLLPFLGYNWIDQDANDANSHYNSFQADLHTHLKRGLQLQVAYTLSKAIDSTSNANDGGDLQDVSNPYLGWKYDLGPSTLNRQQIGFANFVYDLPIFRNTSDRALKAIAGGWQLSGIVTMETGIPINLGIAGNGIGNILQGVTLRPNQSGPVSYVKTPATFASSGNQTMQWFDPSNFSANLLGSGANAGLVTFGNTGFDSVYGPGRDQWQMALYKSFAFTERAHLELRFESYNTFNHTQFNGVNNTIDGGADTGKVNSAFDPRVFQFGAKLAF